MQTKPCRICKYTFQPSNPANICCSIKCRLIRSAGDRPQDDNACWEWNGEFSMYGYGRINISNKHIHIHRVSYETFVGEIPDGLIVCHRCDNRACINPDHLFVGTDADNCRDKVAKGRGKDGRPIPSMQGEKHHMAYLRQIEVLEIYNSTLTQAELARKYGASYGTIADIRKGRTWSSLTNHSSASRSSPLDSTKTQSHSTSSPIPNQRP